MPVFVVKLVNIAIYEINFGCKIVNIAIYRLYFIKTLHASFGCLN